MAPLNPLAAENEELRRQLAAAEQKVRAGESRYGMILNSAMDYGIIALDLDGLVTEWNEGARQIMGWTEAEMLGRPAAMFFTEEDRRAGIPQKEMTAALDHGRGNDERWHLRQDGSRFCAHGEMMPLRDEAGTVQGFIKVLRDRTEQHQAAEKNRADAEFLRSVLSASGDCIKVLDLDAKLTFMSEGGQRVMEVSDFNAIRGCPWPDFWQGQGNEEAKAAIVAARAGGKGHFRGVADTMAGNARWWDVQVTPIFGADGLPEKLLSVSRDMSATYAAEAALRASEEHWRGLFERLQEGLIIGELIRNSGGQVVDWRYLDVNPAWSGQVGLSQGAAVGRTIRDLFPGIEEAWIDEPARVVETGEPATFIRQVGGIGRWYEGRMYRIGPDRFTVIFQEVTERHLAERRRAAMLELGDHLRGEGSAADLTYAGCEVIGRAIKVGRVGFGSIGLDGETLTVEREWVAAGFPNLAGQYRIDDYGAYAGDLRHGDTVVIPDIWDDPRTEAKAEALEALSIGTLINLPVIERERLAAVLYVNDTQPRAWTAEEIAFLKDAAERLRQAIERRRAEQDLQALAASLEQQVAERTRERDRLWRLSRDPFLICDAQGIWLSVNPVWTELLGWTEKELLGRTSEWIEHPDDRDRTRANTGAVADGGGANRFENRFRARDGSYHWFSWTAIETEGLIYCVARDVTAEREQEEARARLENQLRQSQKMEAVGQLTGGLAHDFNNLLTGVTGSLELMQTRIAQGRIKDIDRYINAAQGAAKRAAALTHRLLAFSRRQTLDPKPTDVNRLVHGMEDLIQRTVGPAITLEPMVGAGGLWPTLVDPSQLENALLNLCINARDAMPDGGKITVETGNRWLDERTARERGLPPGQYVSLCVSDTGTGMPPDVIAKAFDPFFTTKPIGQGTGLGLSMIYGFAKQSGGQVRIYSEVGKGTNVCIYLPRHLGEADAAELASELADAPRGEAGQTVLVVDDEPTVRMLVTEVLEDLGYRAIEAADGAAGLQVLQSDTRIDLLVTDVGLPGGMNGRQVADAARIPRPELKVLFITGYAENAVISHGHLDPGMHVLTKPFAMEALASRIKDLIDTSKN
ncbi:MAG: PAS domain S-box protein [Janthinobacterium lividum]